MKADVRAVIWLGFSTKLVAAQPEMAIIGNRTPALHLHGNQNLVEAKHYNGHSEAFHMRTKNTGYVPNSAIQGEKMFVFDTFKAVTEPVPQFNYIFS